MSDYPPSGQQNINLPNLADLTKPKTPTPKGCFGLIIGLIVVLVIIGYIIERVGPSVSITGTSGQMKYSIPDGYSLHSAGSSVAEEVYAAATAHPELKSLSVDLEFKEELVDKYGKPVEGPFIMGTIQVDDLDEVRRYTKDAYDLNNEDWYADQIRELRYSQFLKGEAKGDK